MTSRERRTVLLSLGLILTGLVATRVAPAAARDYRARQERLEPRRGILAEPRGLAAGFSAMEARSDSGKARLHSLAGRLLDGRTRLAAEAALASLVERLAVEAGARAERVEPVADSATAGGGRLLRVAVRANFEGSTQQLVETFRRLEDGTPILRVRDLALELAGAPDVLKAVVEVEGWFLSPGS